MQVLFFGCGLKAKNKFVFYVENNTKIIFTHKSISYDRKNKIKVQWVQIKWSPGLARHARPNVLLYEHLEIPRLTFLINMNSVDSVSSEIVKCSVG